MIFLLPSQLERAIKWRIAIHQPGSGARAYFFKAICHEFDDVDCQRLLGNTLEAISHESSLLIDEWVLPDGVAPLAGASEYMFMLMLLSGMERSESQWKALLNSVGLEIKKIWRTDGVSEGVIETLYWYVRQPTLDFVTLLIDH